MITRNWSYRGLDPFVYIWASYGRNWKGQGGDAGLYSNDDIHAVRIVAMEPTTDRRGGFKHGRQFASHANERLRILGEIPLRKFGKGAPGASATGSQPLDPDGNPDTSFLAKIPADAPFTFQTLDRDGMVLNMAQTWELRLPAPLVDLPRGTLKAAVKDRQGNVSRIERTFSVATRAARGGQ